MEQAAHISRLEAYLANERTFLSYIRTASTVAVLAVALFKFFTERLIIYIGFGTLFISLLVLLLGLYRFFQERKRIHRLVAGE